MDPFYFEANGKQLYGVMQEPTGSTVRDYAVLFCYPFGYEYIRAHRSLRTLARKFGEQGITNLRFDYFGTGDSAGDEFTLVESLAGLEGAARYLLEFSGADSIRIVGVRLGASLAVQLLESDLPITHLGLWDPVWSGSQLLEEVSQFIEPRPQSRAEPWWLNGTDYSPALLQELEALHVNFDGLQQKLFCIQSASNAPQIDSGLCKTFVSSESIEWNEVDMEGSFRMPHEIVSAVSGFILE